MEYKNIEWEGFFGFEFEFMGKSAKLIKPNIKPNGKWALKTEYFGAFPALEIELLNRGWHIAYNENINRWAEDEDILRKRDFIGFVSEEFGLDKKCAAVGMSCGGMYAVKTAAAAPELFSCLYLDAPVINLLSCPCALGVAENSLYDEFFSFTGKTISEMLSYRDHPLDKLDILVKENIPIILVGGDSDKTVPFCENGALVDKYYREHGGIIETYVKAGCDHHPHGLDDPKIIANFIEKY